MEHKRRRIGQDNLQELVCIRNVSLSAVQRVLNSISDGEDAVSWRQLQAAGRQRYEQVKHAITLPAEDGGDVTIPMAHPMKLFSLLLAENATIRNWFEASWTASPSSPARPWQLLLGWDEFAPGNKLAIQNSRKTMVLSFAFLEMRQHLGCDASWITPLVVRTSFVQHSVEPDRDLSLWCLVIYEPTPGLTMAHCEPHRK